MRVGGCFAALAMALLVACSTGTKIDLPRDSLGRATIVLDRNDENRSIGLAPGASVAVQLPSDPPGGKTWRVDSLDQTVLTLASSGYRPASGTGPGLAVFTFRAVGPGSVTVHLSYGSASDPASATQEFSFVVSVT